jgi:pimeloyl-ACP methyl ester carboxylesterase
MHAAERLALRGDGVELVADAAGPAGAPTILFLHGGGQTRKSWGTALKEAAARGYRALALDQRGHGDSNWSPDGDYRIERFAADLRRVMEQIHPEPVLVGASLGGLAGLLAAAAPASSSIRATPRGLVLVDITPRIEREGSKEITAFMDSAPDGFASLEEAADAVAAYLPHRRRPQSTAGLSKNLRLRNGRYHWHWDPAFLRMGREAQSRIDPHGPNVFSEAARSLTIPTLLIRGSRSRIVSDAGMREFLEMVPHAEAVEIPDAHHMVAGDANDAFNDAVFQFVDKQAGR